MTMKEEKRQFVDSMLENFDEKIDTNVYKEDVLKILLKDTNGGKLYKYRSVNEYALDNLENGTLYCAEPSTFNDPFDCQMGIGIWDAYVETIQDNMDKYAMYLFQFLEASFKQTVHEDYTEDEKIIFRKLNENEQVKKLLNEIKTENYSDDELILIIRNLCVVIISLVATFMQKGISEIAIQIMQSQISSMFDSMTIDKLNQFESISNISDCAKAFEISEDGDDTTLLKWMEKNLI